MTRLIKGITLFWALFAVGVVSGAELKQADKPTPAQSEKGVWNSECKSSRPLFRIQSLIEQLGNDQFKEREQASAELVKLGSSVLPSLREARQNRDAEIRRRAQRLIELIDPPPAIRGVNPNPGKCYL
jgi:hypothetical protein